MRVGVDGRKIPKAAEYGPIKSFSHGRDLGMEGLYFRTALEMSPTLDHGEMREIKAHADSLGMYLESGLGKVTPYATPEAPELRMAGDGDILLGFRWMMEACNAADITEVWIGTANFKGMYTGNFSYDRFRTDVTWEEQLAATERFLRKLLDRPRSRHPHEHGDARGDHHLRGRAVCRGDWSGCAGDHLRHRQRDPSRRRPGWPPPIAWRRTSVRPTSRTSSTS